MTRYAGKTMSDYLSNFGPDGMTKTSNHSMEQVNRTTAQMGDTLQGFEDIGGDIDGSFNNNSGNVKINNGIENAVINDNKRFYGGDSRSFTYNGGKGESSLYDSPMSMATMAGYNDTNDSAGETSKFLDKYITDNRINQQQNDSEYKQSGTFDYDSDKSRAIDYGAYHDRVFNTHGPNSNYENSDVEMGKLFGDMGSWLNKPPKWAVPKAPSKPKDEKDLQDLMD